MPWRPEDRQNTGYSTAEYKRKRLATMRRAGWRCEVRLPGCAGAASQCDHIDGIDADPHHTRMRAVCTPCHRQITAQQGSNARRGDPPPNPRTVW